MADLRESAGLQHIELVGFFPVDGPFSTATASNFRFPQTILLRCPGLDRPPLVGGINGVADCCFLGDCINAGRMASSGKPSGSAAVLFHCPRHTALSVAHSLAASLVEGYKSPPPNVIHQGAWPGCKAVPLRIWRGNVSERSMM